MQIIAYALAFQLPVQMHMTLIQVSPDGFFANALLKTLGSNGAKETEDFGIFK